MSFFSINLKNFGVTIALQSIFWLAQSAWASPQLEAPYSLQECYELALQSSEDLKITLEEIKVAEARYAQSLSAIYPSLDLIVSQRYRDNADFGRVQRSSSAQDDPGNSTGGNSGGLGRSQAEGRIALQQPIFSGFRNILLARAAHKDMESTSFDLARANQLLFQDVAQIFYNSLLEQARLDVLRSSEKTVAERITDLEEFFKLGKSRESEVLAAQAELADLKADLENAQGGQRTALEVLAFFTALPANQLKLEIPKLPLKLDTVENYLKKSEERDDIKAAKALVEAEEQRSKAARRERWPEISIGGSGYPYEDPERSREWELELQLSMPLYDGGLLSGRVAEADARSRQALYNSQLKLRAAEREVRVAHAEASSSLSQYQTLQKLVEATRKSYQVQRRDYGLGVVTNVDVLLAIRSLQQAEIRLVQALFQAHNSIARLQVASGVVSDSF